MKDMVIIFRGQVRISITLEGSKAKVETKGEVDLRPTIEEAQFQHA